jgi:GTPase SAR1 family protein
MSKENIEKALQKWLSISDMVPFDVIMATALAPLFQGDAIWLLVVGPSGSGKTELVRALRGDYVVSVDTITSNSLISGLKVPGKDETFGMLETLDKKLLVIKDLTTMLEKTAASRDDTVFAQLRSAYDGEYAAFHGSGHRRQAYKAQFGLIGAVTPAIDRYRAVNSALGERFLTIRIEMDPNEENEAIEKSQDNRGTETAMRQEIGHAVTTTLNEYRDIATEIGCPLIQGPDLKKIRALSYLLSHMRTEVARDHRHNIIGTPSPAS